MKKLFYFLVIIFFGNFSFAQKVEIQTLLKDKISIRAIQIYNEKSGTRERILNLAM